MRDSAVLTRPLVVASSWHEPMPRRLALRPTLLILGGLFVVALAVGFGISRLVPGGTPVQRVSDAEYAAVVAQLYLRDHDLSLARERLSVVGTPGDVVRKGSDAAKAGLLASPNDQAALDLLSAALIAPSTGDSSQTAAGNATTSALSTPA